MKKKLIFSCWFICCRLFSAWKIVGMTAAVFCFVLFLSSKAEDSQAAEAAKL